MSVKTKVPVAVIIVNYKTPDLTRRALAALFRSSVEPAQVVLVDNNSNDGALAMVRAEFPTVIVLENKENVGFAKANNQAIRTVVNQPYVWLLNSDTETGSRSLEQLYTFMTEHEKVGVVGPKLVYPTGELQSVGGFFPSAKNIFTYFFPIDKLLSKKIRRSLKSIALYPQPLPKEGRQLDYVTGAACLLCREALDEVGLLSENYFMYFEETDLCYRLQQAGWRAMVIDTDPVMHVYGGSYKTKFDPIRLQKFVDSLQKFVRINYSGCKKYFLLAEITLLAPVGLFLKRFKNL